MGLKSGIRTILLDNVESNFGNALYASVLVLTQKMETAKALDIMGKIGDVDVINFLCSEEGNDKEVDIVVGGFIFI